MLKSIIVAAPAGSGKTEELSRRYIELLASGVPPERILTLTFTDKAAIEMKERILQRLREKYPALYDKVRESILRLRISTFHSFCLGLLRRFAPHVGLDPALDTLDESGASTLWYRALYETLVRIAAEPGTPDYDTLMNLVTRKAAQDWEGLINLFEELYKKRVAVERARLAPVAELEFHTMRAQLIADPIGPERIPDYKSLFPPMPEPEAVAHTLARLEENRLVFQNPGGGPKKRSMPAEIYEWNVRISRYRGVLLTLQYYEQFKRIFDLFRRRFLSAYDARKHEAGMVDFVDMEHQALRIISENDQWLNILCAFDEQTDHLLVDEFQDTSYLQLAIIHRLLDEWLAGEGAKTERGIEPSIFIVGDVKQSIYLFRDAKVELFSDTRETLRTAPAAELDERTIEYNYRSLQAIVDFTNALFSRLMTTGPDAPPWRTPYELFKRGRKNDAPGLVEILLDRSDDNMDERRRLEADMVCRRIRLLTDRDSPFVVYRRPAEPDAPEIPDNCGYGDIAILLRSRTHLGPLTDALHRYRIPFVTVGGKGFYSEPEVRHLQNLLAFLVDPGDGYALYTLLRGPLFSVPERDILLTNNEPGRLLWNRLQARTNKDPGLTPLVTRLKDWLAQVNRRPLAGILELALTECRAWSILWEPQRVANIRKFLHIIESMELEGRHPLRILDFLESGPDEKRADVSLESRKSVQVMTVHGAKGLQFPVVFYVGGDIGLSKGNTEELLIEERTATEAWVSYIQDPELRKQNSFHSEYREKEYEEEKRVFYVACTRATEALFLTGVWGKKIPKPSTLFWLNQHLGLAPENDRFRIMPAIPGVCCRTGQDIPDAAPVEEHKEQTIPEDYTAPLPHTASPPVRAITRDMPTDFQRHGEAAVGLGEVVHAIIEKISQGTLITADRPLTAEANRLLRLHGLPSDLCGQVIAMVKRLESNPSTWRIIAPQPDAETELPVTYFEGETLRTGRVDRVIFTPDEIRIYDYKTFPVREAELAGLAAEYHEHQLRHYATALRAVYPDRNLRTFLLFTALPRVIETGVQPPDSPGH